MYSAPFFHKFVCIYMHIYVYICVCRCPAGLPPIKTVPKPSVATALLRAGCGSNRLFRVSQGHMYTTHIKHKYYIYTMDTSLTYV